MVLDQRSLMHCQRRLDGEKSDQRHSCGIAEKHHDLYADLHRGGRRDRQIVSGQYDGGGECHSGGEQRRVGIYATINFNGVGIYATINFNWVGIYATINFNWVGIYATINFNWVGIYATINFNWVGIYAAINFNWVGIYATINFNTRRC